MNEVISKQLNILKSSEERQRVYETLAYLGLRYYFSIHKTDQYINLGELYSLAESISSHTRTQTGSNQTYTKRIVRPAPAVNPPPSSSSAAKASEIHYGSKYRPEALSHFPFIDENGTVYDVFRNGLVNKPDLLNMGQPGREKLIQKVFDTMRFDRNGIRLSDLPEALQMVGIDIPTDLKRILEKTRSKNVNGPIKDDDNDDQSQEPQPFEYYEKFVTFKHWNKIIRRFLALRMDGRNISSIEDILGETQFSKQRHYRGGQSEEDEIDLESFDDDPYEETKKHSRGRSHGNREEENEDSAEEGWNNLFQGDHPPLRRKKGSEPPQDKRKNPAKAYYHGLKKVKSRIGDLVKHDKNQFYREKAKTDQAALSAIAKQRVDTISSRPRPPSIRDPEFFASSGATTLKNHNGENIYRNRDFSNPVTYDSANKTVARLKDLSSGMAALQIADSFLNSRVGKELTSKIERDVLPEDISAKAAEAQALKLLGLREGNRETDLNSQDEERSERSLPLEHLRRKPNHFNKSTAILSGDNTRDYRQQYVTGWKNSRGGWVADFGPDHTRAFYTGPEKARASLREQKEPYVLDEMMFNIAKDIHGVTNDKFDDSDTTTSINVNIKDQTHRVLTVTTASDTSKAVLGYQGLTDFSESTLSPIPVVPTGAGVKGILATAVDFSDDSNDGLIGKLQDSVALKDVISKPTAQEKEES